MAEKAAAAEPKAIEFETVRVVNRQLLKFEKDVPRHVMFEGKMHLGKEMKAKEGEKKKEPATLADVVNLETGEQVQIIISAVVKSVLEEEYPKDAYLGKCFTITKRGKAPGKSYEQYTVIEVKVKK